MRRFALLALAAILEGGCNPSYVTLDTGTTGCDACGDDTGNPGGDDSGTPVDPNDVDNDDDGYTENAGDCNDGSASVYPGATEICEDGVDQDCNGGDAECDPEPSGDQLVLNVGTPGGVQVATMFVHAEFVTEVAAGYGSWQWDGRYAWTDGVELGFNPGVIEAVRWNATYCTVETENEADASCTNWLAYGTSESEAHLTASTGVTYFDSTYGVSTVTFCWDNDGDGSDDECGSSAWSEF